MVEVGGGDDGGPCSASVLNDWSGDGFVCVNEYFLVFAPCCTAECFVYFYGFICLSFGVFYVFENVSLGSMVSPNIFGKGLVVRILLLILMDLEYLAGSGVNRVVSILLVLGMRLLCVAQLVIVSMYGCSIDSADL